MMSPGECRCIVERTEGGMLPGDTRLSSTVGGVSNVLLAVTHFEHNLITLPAVV